MRGIAAWGGGKVFHGVEKKFPLCGKTAEKFSIVWKKRVYFSMVWKTFFHGVENRWAASKRMGGCGF